MANRTYSSINDFRLSEPTDHHIYILTSHFKRLLLLHKSFSLNLRLYETGKEEEMSVSRIVYIGTLENLDWLKDSMLPDTKLRENRKINLAECWNEVKKWSEKAMVIVDINRYLTPFLPPGGHTTYPWIRQVIFLDSNSYKSRRYRIMSEFRRIMRRQGYAAWFTSASVDVEFFYEKLYLPFVGYRFGSSARPRKFKELQRALKKGFLIQIFFEDRWIAGDIFRICGNEIQVLASGLLPDYQQKSHRLARTVLYPILIEWASSKGYRKINLLRSRANLGDGVFASKAHRGATAEIDCWTHSALRIYIPAGLKPPGIWKTQLVKKAKQLVPLGDVRAGKIPV